MAICEPKKASLIFGGIRQCYSMLTGQSAAWRSTYYCAELSSFYWHMTTCMRTATDVAGHLYLNMSSANLWPCRALVLSLSALVPLQSACQHSWPYRAH